MGDEVYLQSRGGAFLNQSHLSDFVASLAAATAAPPPLSDAARKRARARKDRGAREGDAEWLAELERRRRLAEPPFVSFFERPTGAQAGRGG